MLRSKRTKSSLLLFIFAGNKNLREEKYVVSAEGGVFAAAAERSPYFIFRLLGPTLVLYHADACNTLSAEESLTSRIPRSELQR
jgi:hypothetical protein